MPMVKDERQRKIFEGCEVVPISNRIYIDGLFGIDRFIGLKNLSFLVLKLNVYGIVYVKDELNGRFYNMTNVNAFFPCLQIRCNCVREVCIR